MTDYTELSNAEDEAGYLKESVEIIPEAIREEFVRLPADMAFWGERYAEAVKAYLVAEHECKVVRAQVRLATRELGSLDGRKLTEADVDAKVETDERYRQAKLAEIEAEAAKLAAKVKLDAVATKRDMCISLGAHIRAEMSPTSLNR